MAMLVGYIWLIGRMADVQRVFAYHGAEHRTIHAYEHGRVLTPENIRECPNAHPRCGTAFLLTVMVISLVVFVLLGAPPIWLRLIRRIILIPDRLAGVRSSAPRAALRGQRRLFAALPPEYLAAVTTTRDPTTPGSKWPSPPWSNVIALQETGAAPPETSDTAALASPPGHFLC